MEETERNRRIVMWKKFANTDEMDKYNGLEHDTEEQN